MRFSVIAYLDKSILNENQTRNSSLIACIMIDPLTPCASTYLLFVELGPFKLSNFSSLKDRSKADWAWSAYAMTKGAF